ncbi:alcohol dehydrogenase, partial [Pseudoalteromonas phenolica]
MFKAIIIDKKDGNYTATLDEVSEQELMPGDVDIEVLYSTLNYKDALAITGKSPVVRSFPMIPGIDFVGKVSASNHSDYERGQLVIL